MKRSWAFAWALLPALSSNALSQTPLGTAFTYQGQLKQNGQPASGPHDLVFTLWNHPTAALPANQLGGPVVLSAVSVSDGLFSVPLNAAGEFGPSAFNGERRWLQITVNGMPLQPRQELTATPYALWSAGPWVTGVGGMLSYSDGNVGIGTVTPTSLLEVSHSDVSGFARMEVVNGDGPNPGKRIGLVAYGSSTSTPDTVALETTGATNFTIYHNAGTRLAMDGSGNVGIGTVTPTSLLEVSRSDVSGFARMEVVNGDGPNPGKRIGLVAYGSSTSTPDTVALETTGATNFTIYHNAGTRLAMDGSGNVGIGTSSPTAKLHIGGTAGVDGIRFPDGTVQTTAATPQPAQLWSSNSNDIYNSNSGNVGIGTSAPVAKLDVRAGSIFVTNSLGAGRVGLSPQSSGGEDTGIINLAGPSGNITAVMSNVAGTPNHGAVAVAANGVLQATMFVDNLGNGVIQADIKNFREANPADPNTEIWYACIEGPEAAAYVRGTSRLIDGKAIVSLPDHFQAVAVAAGLTVQVTPHSADSKGLAVVERALDHFTVQELFGGAGSYDFDWRVEAVRRGWENYRVIRPKDEVRPAMGAAAPTTSGR